MITLVKNSVRTIVATVAAISFFVGVVIVSAQVTAGWRDPSEPPPRGNPLPMINTGSVAQSKTGGLTVNTGNNTIGFMVARGKTGLNTTNAPRRTLDVNGEIIAVNRLTMAQDTGTATRTWHLDNNAGRFRIFEQPNIDTSGTERLTILNSSGNVGIGTAAPGSKLDVAGDVRGTRLCIGTDCRAVWPAGGGPAPIVTPPSVVASENVRIVRGSIGYDGGSRVGDGFVCAYDGNCHRGVGIYAIRFSPDFSGVPSIAATINRRVSPLPAGLNANVTVDYRFVPTYGGGIPYNAFVATFYTFNDSNDPADRDFDFIAIGPQ